MDFLQGPSWLPGTSLQVFFNRWFPKRHCYGALYQMEESTTPPVGSSGDKDVVSSQKF